MGVPFLCLFSLTLHKPFFPPSCTKPDRQRCRARCAWFRNVSLVCPASTSLQAVVSSCVLRKIGLDGRCWKKPDFAGFFTALLPWKISSGTSDFAQRLPISRVFTVNFAWFRLLQILEEQHATSYFVMLTSQFQSHSCSEKLEHLTQVCL